MYGSLRDSLVTVGFSVIINSRLFPPPRHFLHSIICLHPHIPSTHSLSLFIIIVTKMVSLSDALIEAKCTVAFQCEVRNKKISAKPYPHSMPISRIITMVPKVTLHSSSASYWDWTSLLLYLRGSLVALS